jgi:acetyl-CoA/propionyl-CoA carboxylase biotin carboxyl carrier protein
VNTQEPLAFERVLVANRGEIALRVIRGCADAGLTSIACFATPDADMPFVASADVAVELVGQTAAETYLSADAVLAAAVRTDADAIHPGYGFLSEDADFAAAVIAAGLVWIGPTPEAMRLLSDKVSARRLAAEVGAPLTAGTPEAVLEPAQARAFALEHGLPIAIKAAHGGGGRGLKVVHHLEDVETQFDSAVREAEAAFGRGECFVERYLDRARHVEAQVIADQHGLVVVAGTRDCSLQRRHQKLVEEAPAPFLTDAQRTAIYDASKALCRRAGYHGAGTVEFLVGADGTVSFLEVNTRLQVEHPVTEETTGLDLVVEQFRIASGLPLSVQDDPAPRGHSFEFRINGEDPGRGFLPAPGVVGGLSFPSWKGVRVDSGVQEGSVIGGQFDSLLAKLIVTGPDRESALRRARIALADTRIDGLATVLPFHRAVLEEPDFVGDGCSFAVHTRWIEDDFATVIPAYSSDDGDDDPDVVPVSIGRGTLRVRLPSLSRIGGEVEALIHRQIASVASADQVTHGDGVVSPMQGTVVAILAEGSTVAEGDMVAVVEAMKMENVVRAHGAGTVQDVTAVVGESVAQGQRLGRLEAPADD